MVQRTQIRELLRKLLRYDISAADFTQQIDPDTLQDSDGQYEYTLNDMIVLIGNLIGKNPDGESLKAWLKLVFDRLGDLYALVGTGEIDPSHSTLGIPYPVNDIAMGRYIHFTFRTWGCCGGDPEFDLPLMLEDIRNQGERRPVRVHLWSQSNKVMALHNSEPEKLKKLNEAEKAELRRLMADLAEEGEPYALQQLGYSCYGGDALFDCDWPRSRDCFLRLMDMDNVDDHAKCSYANTLGYIFYYGRCNGGVPEYDRAFTYFSIGAAGGYFESMYKLSDMYMHGYYVAKNTSAAETLVRMVYDENLGRIQHGDFACNFADAALRMGNLCRAGVLQEDPLYYCTLADFALRRRLKYDHYGDSGVMAGMQNVLEELRRDRPLRNKTTIRFADVPPVIDELFEGHCCRVTLDVQEDGMQLTVQRLANPGEHEIGKVFEVYTDLGFCDLTDCVQLTLCGGNLPQLPGRQSFIANRITSERTKSGLHCCFRFFDELKLALTVRKFKRRLPAEAKRKMQVYNFAAVTFAPGGKSYDYICDIDDVAVGDHVIVLAHGEEKEVEVVRLFRMPMGDMALPPERYKKIVRKV